MNKLVQACELSLNDWSATFSETMPEPVYSKKYKRWKKKLFDKMRDDHYHIFTTKTIKVMWIAAIISMMLLTAFVIPSSREYILDNLDEFIPEPPRSPILMKKLMGKKRYRVKKSKINEDE